MPDDAKTVARRYFEEFHNQRRDDLLEVLIAPGLIESTRVATARVREAFPDCRFTIAAQIAEGELVATVWDAQGSHQGTWQSPIGPIPASGRSVTWSATTTLRIREGQVVELVGSHWDHLGLLQQLGAVSDAEARPGA